MAETVIVRQCQYGDVRVLYGNILRVEGDLLVTTANNRLAGREGLDEKIQQKAGPELREFCHGTVSYTHLTLPTILLV